MEKCTQKEPRYQQNNDPNALECCSLSHNIMAWEVILRNHWYKRDKTSILPRKTIPCGSVLSVSEGNVQIIHLNRHCYQHSTQELDVAILRENDK